MIKIIIIDPPLQDGQSLAISPRDNLVSMAYSNFEYSDCDYFCVWECRIL